MKIAQATALALLFAAAGAAQAQTTLQTGPTMPNYAPTRPNAVKPNSQNLMQGPSYWTPGQRTLNVPGANTNPTQRRETAPWPPAPIPAPVAPRTEKPGS